MFPTFYSRSQKYNTYETSSDDEEDHIDYLTLYKILELNAALRSKSYLRTLPALTQLTLMVQEFYGSTHCTKALKRCIERDVKTAIVEFDGGQRTKKALKLLLSAVARTFPQSKKAEMAREYKSKTLQLARDAKRQQRSQQQQQPVSLLSLPRECIDGICDHLDPISLTALMCACRQLHTAIATDHLLWSKWNVLVLRHGRNTSSSSSTRSNSTDNASLFSKCPQLSLFLQCVSSSSSPSPSTGAALILHAWKSDRILIDGKNIRWMSPETRRRIDDSDGDNARAYICLSEEDVFRWFRVGGKVSVLMKSGSRKGGGWGGGRRRQHA